MQASKSKKSSKSSQPRAPSGKNGKSSKSKSAAFSSSSKGAAQFQGDWKIGLSDLIAHKVSWIAGYIWVGNGTLGVTDAVYYYNRPQTKLATGGACHVPVLAGDNDVGANYVKNLEQMYARKVIRRLRARIISLNPSTANAMVACVAPVAGTGDSLNTTWATGLPAQQTMSNVVGMTREKPIPSYESRVLDLTSFVHGGSGPRQNEFDIASNAAASSTFVGQDLVGVAPCCLCVAGVNNTTALRGTITHMIVIEQVCDYLDFLGGAGLTNPLALATVAEFEEHLKQLALSAAKVKNEELFRTVETLRRSLLTKTF